MHLRPEYLDMLEDSIVLLFDSSCPLGNVFCNMFLKFILVGFSNSSSFVIMCDLVCSAVNNEIFFPIRLMYWFSCSPCISEYGVHSVLNLFGQLHD